MTFGLTLAKFRRARGWSQEALGLRADLSQRHVSFLETGRAHPGQRSLSKLAAALALKGWEHRALLASLTQSPESAAAAVPDHAVMSALIERFSRWPAYAFRPDGGLIGSNAPLDVLLSRAAPHEDLWEVTAPASGPNIYDLVFHPDGLMRWLENPGEVIPETLRRLRIEVAHDPSLLPLLARIEAYPCVQRYARSAALAPPLLIERYRIDGVMLSIISVISHLASPGELDLDFLRIESFVPADEVSERYLLTS
jgi:transcriptional regulator with XRE-family HTH domain